MSKEAERIAYLFQCYFNGIATSEEQSELVNWILQEKNTAQVKELLRKAWITSYGEEDIFSKEESEAILQHILKEGSEKRSIQKKRVFFKRAIAVAAVLLVLLSTGYFLYINKKPQPELTKHVEKLKNDVLPGKNKATLMLANGSVIHLNNKKMGTIAKQGKTSIVKIKNGQLAYNKEVSPSNDRKEIQYNTLRTPRGGQYQVTLPDGSKVWLNAASSLKFPATFNGKNRTVQLTGEAYFEINQNKNKPFKVIANEVKVVVLGTHFNMNTYKNNATVKTTLIEGAIKVARKGKSVVLEPGQQAGMDRNAKNIKVSEANIEEVVAWKNGVFYFDGDNMDYIMRRISRWYNVKVVYKNGVPSGHYTGVISRNTNLSQVLKVLELSGIHFEIKGRNIVVG
ncbi:MAG TPA: FecR family protein [Chitinophagaceae bacterium]|nr:FecR family protein [Chitinophagaceae bacterium]